ncbi:hypothetical protein K438DRAFT_1755872 [Mycena galopus ATCC 62051]|nr:hypothetical protein K438DRAFT_1755872 [Mycena galopus ATCC 62051]
MIRAMLQVPATGFFGKCRKPLQFHKYHIMIAQPAGLKLQVDGLGRDPKNVSATRLRRKPRLAQYGNQVAQIVQTQRLIPSTGACSQPPTKSNCSSPHRKTAQRPIVNCFKIAKYALEASDESLELSCHAGELALHRCYFDRIARSPLAKRPCGYLKVRPSPVVNTEWLANYLQTMEADILSVSTLALLVTTSDLNTVPMPDRFAAQLLYLIFGIMSHHLPGHQVQCRFYTIFEAIIGAADSAYITQTENARKTVSHDSPNRRQQVSQKPERFSQVRNCLRVVRESEEELVESRLSRVRQTVSSICVSVSQEVDEFMVYARRFPQAFMTGFNSALSSADPQPPTLKVVKDLRTPSPGPLRTPSRSPRHVTPKPYLRANAPSPPSRIHRIAPRRRSQPLSQEEYAYSYYAVCSEPHLTQCTSIQCYRFCAPAPGTNYTPPSPPPAFAPFGQNRSLVFSPAP